MTGAPGEDANAGGDLDVGKNLTIQGAGARRTVIDGGAIDGVFDILPAATVTLADVMIRNGRIVDSMPPVPNGGGIRNRGTLTLRRVVVRANFVGFGPAAGGVFSDGPLEAIGSAIEGNVAGGFLAGTGGIQNSGLMTLTASTVSGNTAGGAFSGPGGVFNLGTLTLIDSTVSGNSSSSRGVLGPGLANPGTMNVVGSAIVSNGTGVASLGTVTLTNTIVADACQSPGGFTSAGGNLATDAGCGLAGPGDALVADAGLGPLGVHGGPTQTHPLRPGSPAIDTALPGPCGPTDQRGMPRPQDGDGNTTAVCDKGPFEFTPPIFADVAVDHFARGAIEALWVNGVTGGCGVAPPVFCPDDVVTRGQIAVLLLRALEGPGFTPPPPAGLFADVPVNHPFAPWIESLFQHGITSGCGTAPLIFCPDNAVTRGQMAVLLLRALAVPGFVPPPAGGFFADVPAADPFAPRIDEFVRRGLTSGCQGTPPGYCPADPTTRAQIAVFLVRGFGLGF